MYSPIIGFGTGRCGTTSLARLFMQQEEIAATHEYVVLPWEYDEAKFYHRLIDLSTVSDAGQVTDERLFMELLDEVKKGNYDIHDGIRNLYKTQPKRIADVSFSWLNYVEKMIEIFPDLRGLCLIRDREETVESWMHLATENYWEDGDGNKRQYFPHYALPQREGISQYWADYNLKAFYLCSKHEHLHMIPIEALNGRGQQKKIMEKVGIDKPKLDVGVQESKTVAYDDDGMALIRPWYKKGRHGTSVPEHSKGK